MHVRTVHLRSFRRFSELTIADLPATARLIVLAGPNGTGKSSLFDAFRSWHQINGLQQGTLKDPLYYSKVGLPEVAWQRSVTVDFHEKQPIDLDARKKFFYIRSAYRHEADFNLDQLQRMGSPLDRPPVAKLIDPDKSVSDNYKRMVSQTLKGVYSGEHDNMLVPELREFVIGELRASMERVFGNLILRSPGDPLQDGSFFFDKGVSKHFHYKNLSGGEKAAFDLILDMVVKRQSFDDTIFCIDEPESHLNTRVQGRLLQELFQLVSERSQLWVATHSIGMMAKARQLQEANPGAVVFLDFGDKDFDQQITMIPVTADRDFWRRTLDIALGDVAELVAPRRVVLCDGHPAVSGSAGKAELDAHCFRTIFAHEYPDVAFLSVGSQSEVTDDRLGVAAAIETVVSGTRVTRVVDRDDRAPDEVAELERQGVKVLSRRHLEAYLLDDEVLDLLCASVAQREKLPEVLAAKQHAIKREVLDRRRPSDDIKSAAGAFYVAVRSILRLSQHGNSSDAFLRYTLAPLVVPGTAIYAELKRDILGK